MNLGILEMREWEASTERERGILLSAASLIISSGLSAGNLKGPRPPPSARLHPLNERLNKSSLLRHWQQNSVLPNACCCRRRRPARRGLFIVKDLFAIFPVPPSSFLSFSYLWDYNSVYLLLSIKFVSIVLGQGFLRFCFLFGNLWKISLHFRFLL